MVIDLHSHSTASDGTSSPTELVHEAVTAGVDVLALTDHDTVAGWDEATRAALSVGLTLVRGIEITCDRAGQSIHLLGYLTDPQDEPLMSELAAARDSRLTRMERMVERMAADGIPISYGEVLAHVADGATVGRPHLADALVGKGILPDREAAFADWLNDTSPYYVRHYAPDPVRAVELVRAAGGVSVLAHPFTRTRGQLLSVDVIEEMAHAGLAGLEVEHRDHDEATRVMARALAQRLQLVTTGSSDYHGTGKPNALAENVTSSQAFDHLFEQQTATAVIRP